VIVSQRNSSEDHGVTRQEVLTGIHATHDVVVHRLVKPGDLLTTSLEVVALANIKPGAKATTRLETVDQHGEAVASTTQDAIYLGVPTDGKHRADPAPPPPIDGTERRGDPVELTVDIGAGDAHTYTECARIWNPIHTDVSAAKAAGLPDIILHGTANLAHGVSAVVAVAADGDPHLVRRIQCRFAAMVRLPSTMTIRVWPANQTAPEMSTVPFEVLNDKGAPAVANGLVVLGAPGLRSYPL
jgi:acyl dehydratase